MKRPRSLLVLAALAVAGAACVPVRPLYDTAPGPRPGTLLVVGSEGSEGAVWLVDGETQRRVNVEYVTR